MARSKRFRPAPRRKMIWARSIDLTFGSPVPAVGTAVDLLAQFRADGGTSLGATVTRVRLDLTLDWSWTGNPVAGDQLAVGVLVDQIQPAQAEVPRPGLEEHADWMYWRRRGISPSFSAVPTGPAASTANRYLITEEIDVQSQRKMEELGQTLWLVLDPTYAAAPTAITTAVCNASVLLKLP